MPMWECAPRATLRALWFLEPGRQDSLATVWLGSDDASYLSGHMLVVDGGMTIGGFEL
jgi:hypothetical protein